MKKPLRLIGLLTICAVLLVPLGVMADDIAPSAVSGSFTVGGSTTIAKQVTVNSGPPTTVQTDIFFLSDTTGSMGGTIATVQTNAGAIMTNTSSLGNVAWGVGNYRDGNVDAYGYQLNQAITTNQALVQAGIDTWSATGGGDTPEDNLMAVRLATTDPASGWRVGSARILVQFGDAPGLDPASDGTTLATATAALVGPPVTKLIAVDVGIKDQLGQETAMVAASGGTYLLNPSQATLIAAVEAAISESFTTYSNVALDLSEVPVGVLASFTPLGGINGAFDRSIDRFFDFSLTFDFTAAGDYDFNVYALVDGARVATEHDIFHVSAVPVPPSVLLLGSGLLGLIPLRRKKLI